MKDMLRWRICPSSEHGASLGGLLGLQCHAQGCSKDSESKETTRKEMQLLESISMFKKEQKLQEDDRCSSRLQRVLQIAEMFGIRCCFYPLFKEYSRVHKVAKLLLQVHTLLLEEEKWHSSGWGTALSWTPTESRNHRINVSGTLKKWKYGSFHQKAKNWGRKMTEIWQKTVYRLGKTVLMCTYFFTQQNWQLSEKCTFL